ncbi:MAG TPA: Gmad2 immunoglobulin-like domain-containing protein [Mycobacteriales bacterium]|jgi:spore germination protein GerM
MKRRLLATAVVLAAAAACGNDATPSVGASGSATPPATTQPSATATAGATPTVTSSPTATGTMRVPVYYLGAGTPRTVLYREFRSVPRSSAVVRSAVDAMLHLAPQDTDYRSVWPPATQVLGVSLSGTVATVDLSGAARSASAGAAVEQASLQQLVHTVTAAAPSVTGVRLRFDGQTKETLWGHVDTRGTLTRRPSNETIAPVWVIEPAHFARVGRTFRVKGTATVFEATVSWAVTRPGSTRTLASGFVTATKGAPERGDFTVDVTLPAGTTGDIVFTAWESSAQDGSVLWPDSKTYRVA